MKSVNRLLALAVAVLYGALISGCSSGAHSTASGTTYAAGRTLYAGNGPVYLAQSAAVCTQADTTMSCCIKKNPANAAEACGAAAWEIAEALATLKGVDVPEREHDDEGEGEGTPEWKRGCMDKYTDCQQEKWKGDCGDCLRRCEGQRGKWPTDMCDHRKKRQRRK